MDHDDYDFSFPYGLGQQKCPICASTSGLLHCGGCKVVSYCSPEHQSAHRSKHKAACNTVKTTRQALEREEAALRAHPGAWPMPADVFNTAVGNLWGIHGTRDYMKARLLAADALVKIDTVVAVEKALQHYTDMLRLCRSDNLGVRDIIPGLLLRLGREQECYNFLKWWATVDDKDHYNRRYDWGDVALPYLDIRDADVFEPVDMFCSGSASLCHLAMLTLLKLRLRLDLETYDSRVRVRWRRLDRVRSACWKACAIQSSNLGHARYYDNDRGHDGSVPYTLSSRKRCESILLGCFGR